MTADAVENLTDERDRYKAEIRNVMGLLRIVVAERDRYREALEAIGYMARCENCAPGYNLIVNAALDDAALDGEG